MRKIAVEQAIVLLKKAEEQAAGVVAATTLADIEKHWPEILNLSQRIHSKLEQGAKGEPGSYTWWGELRQLRRSDDLLCYTHHARNASEHGLAPITDREPGSVALGVGPGAWRFDGTFGPWRDDEGDCVGRAGRWQE